MIPHFEIVKLGVDFLLALSVVLLGVRYLRASTKVRTSELMILEASLKGLIRDAEHAGKTLNDELERRHRGLERTLSDIESAEKRIAESERKSTETVRMIEDALSRARHNMPSEREVAAPRSQSGRNSSAQVSTRPSRERRTEIFDEETEGEDLFFEELAPEPPSFESMAAPAPREAPRQPSSRRVEASVPPTPRVARAEPQMSEVMAAQPLARSIEREVRTRIQEPPRENVGSSFRAVFGIAEDLLRAGRDIQSVATETRLPLERVRMIAETVRPLPVDEDIREAEQRFAAPQSEDPRLGALGIRRQTTTL